MDFRTLPAYSSSPFVCLLMGRKALLEAFLAIRAKVKFLQFR